MSKYYQDYFYKEGLPLGLNALSEDDILTQNSYKIVMDPYRKRISIEKYVKGNFMTAIYDSALLNFRHLNPVEQQAYQKTVVYENEQEMKCLIRNQDDRVVFIEVYTFKEHLCKSCHIYSPQDVLIGKQVMHYTFFDEGENSVSLYDANEHLVLKKIYEADELGQFTTLVSSV